jgi:mxaD protein
MKHLIKGLILSLFLLPSLAFSHGAPRLQVEESITINADPAAVWAAVKDFDSLHKWLPPIKATEAQGGNEKGATRVLTLANDATITEELKKFDEDKMSFMYQITDMSTVGEVVDDHDDSHAIPAVPVSKYKAWITVEAADNGTKVTWLGKFFRAYQGNHHPPAELDDNTAKTAITGIYTTGLENLKSQLEK